MKKILKILFLMLLIVSFGATIVFAKDCPKGLGFVEVQNLKLTCFYQEFDEDGNLAVFGNFVDGVKRRVWEWTEFYFKNPNWKQNEHYSDVRDDVEYIDKLVDVEYYIDKNGRNILLDNF